MGDLLRATAQGGHAIDVLMVRLEIEPASVRRIEHVPDSVVALGQLFGRAPCRWYFPELNPAAGVRGVNQPATIRRPCTTVLVVRRKSELECLATVEI